MRARATQDGGNLNALDSDDFHFVNIERSARGIHDALQRLSDFLPGGRLRGPECCKRSGALNLGTIAPSENEIHSI
ncbi:hypothetical protein MRS60_34615 [Burkholderia pyrrocinia]|uniref:hypothetical protein n=1 Tax=Burkholderia pyrrocinia TaxID=60550 RepID=UPI001FB3EF41|nr:hypothetical protein [Burkholderia pyrrocinia]UOB60241.1 hypothetical protein MRS60_34615 [Burkholderia pyrrocinia]